ncbi:MAG: hypothetical protein JJU37_07570 [Balneolaceae bacterium]|nr:hypothetical protein [Balneolaceae bacterium]
MNELHKETFQNLLEQIRVQVQQLKKQNRDLSKENQRLRLKLNDVHKSQTDIFSSISESERIAMKHHVTGLIEKIDRHLDE